MIQQTVKWVTSICAFYSLLVYSLIYFAFSPHWLGGFMMLSFPALYIFNLFLLFYWFLKRKSTLLIPGALVVVGWLLFQPRTFGFNSSDSPDSTASNGQTLSVMSYNVHGFYIGPGKTHEQRVILKEGVEKIKEWYRNQDNDVLCMPEFFSSKQSKPYNMIKFFTEEGYRYHALLQKGENTNTDEYLGMAVFSKYPIVAVHQDYFRDTNGLIATDIKVGGDTVRVITVHLHSMTLRVNRIFEQHSVPGVKYQVGTSFHRMKNGFIKRAQQAGEIHTLIEKSPYPVMVCGDFNETPYSYVYGLLRKDLENAFEKKGQGFGYTYNAMPSFIRIDNQFYDGTSLEVLNFKTHNDVKFSDHYAISATYRFREK